LFTLESQRDKKFLSVKNAGGTTRHLNLPNVLWHAGSGVGREKKWTNPKAGLTGR